VREAPLGAVGVELHHAADRAERLDRANAELYRLLQGVVHALAAGDRLRERHHERGLAVHLDASRDLDRDAAAFGARDDAGILGAVAVEERHRVSRREPQHARRVVRLRWRQRAGGARLQRRLDVQPGRRLTLRHGLSV
jgi:hypothetical protein